MISSSGEDLPLMELDRAQLKRVLINLFDNAVAAMDGKGRLAVTTEYDKSAGLIRLTVSRRGCAALKKGFTASFLSPIFPRKQGGTGLGLAIVQRIVTDHGASCGSRPINPEGRAILL